MESPDVVYMIVNENGEMWTNRVYTKLGHARARKTRLERDWNWREERFHRKFFIRQSQPIEWEVVE